MSCRIFTVVLLALLAGCSNSGEKAEQLEGENPLQPRDDKEVRPIVEPIDSTMLMGAELYELSTLLLISIDREIDSLEKEHLIPDAIVELAISLLNSSKTTVETLKEVFDPTQSLLVSFDHVLDGVDFSNLPEKIKLRADLQFFRASNVRYNEVVNDMYFDILSAKARVYTVQPHRNFVAKYNLFSSWYDYKLALVVDSLSK